jgi:hypothetical protein
VVLASEEELNSMGVVSQLLIPRGGIELTGEVNLLSPGK